MYQVSSLAKHIHIPNIPPISKKSGWLLRYLYGPYDNEYFDILRGDIISGLTVGLILVPQGLAYSILAGLPPINGLYTTILPLFAYSLLGTSMQLSVGPVTMVSLLTAQILAKYSSSSGLDSEELIDIAAQASFCAGILLIIMGLCNMGSLMNLISHPVLSGFTTGAAFIAGLGQLGPAAGFQSGTNFQSIPKLGQVGYEYNYKIMSWFLKNWHQPLVKEDIYSHVKQASDYDTQKSKEYMIGWSRFNPFASKIFCGVYIPLIILQIIMDKLKTINNTKIKNARWFKILTILHPLMALIALCIAGISAMNWMQDPKLNHDTDITYLGYMQHNINVVKNVPSGLNIIRIPKFRCPIGQMFIDVLPVVFILFKESYAAGRKVANQLRQLDFYNTSQELFALGVCNVLCFISSGYPVAGSFSRTS
jgi:MFS superfamily sulfate permease-like transporter